MSFEAEPGPDAQKEFASLSACFVEGSAEQRARERKIRRRALILSVAVQCVVVALIVLIPLFGKPENIAFANAVPIPPYYHHSAPVQTSTEVRNQMIRRTRCYICFNTAPSKPPISDRQDAEETAPPNMPPGDGPDTSNRWGILASDTRPQPHQPEMRPKGPPKRLVLTHLEPAMLIHRVEPVYPALAKQTRREGKVELRAVIATDGTIQSLQVVSGDALFVRSALDAVGQWRYRATVLNGQPVEIDTYITVVYTLQH